MKSAVHLSLIAVTLLSGTALASGGNAAEPSRTVAFADLDLTHPPGLAVLYQRIRTAALEVCRPLLERDLTFTVRSRSCVQQAIERAVKEANAPALTHYREDPDTLIVAQR